LGPQVVEFLPRRHVAGRQDRSVVVGDPGIHEPEKPDIELRFNGERQIENSPPIAISDHHQVGFDAAGSADSVNPHFEEFPRLIDIHQQIGVVGNGRPIGGGYIVAIIKLDLKGGARNPSTLRQINYGHALSLFVCAPASLWGSAADTRTFARAPPKIMRWRRFRRYLPRMPA